MPPSLLQKGQAGEEIASRHLREKGFKIIEKNWRARWGEIDLIAQKGPILAFVEVKTRHSKAYGRGLDAVNGPKQEKMLRAALQYLQQHPKAPQELRFMVLSIDLKGSDKSIECLEFPLDGIGKSYY